jgi:subtilisin family serine protease
MDVRRVLFGTLFLLALTGCSKTKTVQTVYPKVSDSCADHALPQRHVVRWITGNVTLLEGGTREEVIESFVAANLEQLDFIEPDFSVKLPRPQAAGNLPTSTLTSADNWGVVRINAGAAWANGARGGGITVAVVDTGMDLSHKQLSNQIAYNKGESGTDASGNDRSNNGVDDDRNGFVDDYNGYDFTANAAEPWDYNSHGSHVAGIILAEHSDSEPGPQPHVQGVAPDARVIPLAFIDRSGEGSLFNAMRAIDYAAMRGARVINASWGGSGCSTVLRDQIAGLYNKNVIFVAAAGNGDNNGIGYDIDFFPEYPAAFNLLAQLTVGAVGQFDSRARFSNYGRKAVHLFAPGVDIVSTVPQNEMGPMTGTSMATPFIVGAIASLLSHRPQASMDQIRAALYASAHSDSSYKNASQGRLDLGAAVAELERLAP